MMKELFKDLVVDYVPTFGILSIFISCLQCLQFSVDPAGEDEGCVEPHVSLAADCSLAGRRTVFIAQQ